MLENKSIYIHIPFCKKRCSYCTFLSNCDFSLQSVYFAQLYNEIASYSDHDTTIDTIFVGGGTPSCVEPKYIDGIFTCLRNNFNISESAEITVECNPESAISILPTLVKNGVNRVSFGLQSCNDSILSKIGRLHSYADFLTCIQQFRAHGITNLNADIIIGLPETSAEFLHTVNTVAALPITHISMYALEISPDSQMRRDITAKKYTAVEDQDTLADMYDEARAVLELCGFSRFEISKFAMPTYRCRHNIHYWNADSYYGFGAGAHGYINGVRYNNVADIAQYINTDVGQLTTNKQSITPEDSMTEYVMLRLRLTEGVVLSEFQRRFHRDFLTTYPNAHRLINSNFLTLTSDTITIPDDKFYMQSAILAELL
jgi:oxygen-independent coproporphyrinogen-3 oxidase